MAKARRMYTNFAKGELSPRIEGRPDLAAYYEGGSEILNAVLLRQGGVRRRFGTRFVAEVKDSSKDTVLIPFERSVDDSYVIEASPMAFRFYKNNKTRLMSGGVPLELATPYDEIFLRILHFTQSVDVMYIFSIAHPQQRLSSAGDLLWS